MKKIIAYVLRPYIKDIVIILIILGIYKLFSIDRDAARQLKYFFRALF